VFFEPTFQKHAKHACGGCQVHVLDRQTFQPVRTAVEMLHEFRLQDPRQFAWRDPPYEYEHDKRPIDILYGSTRLRDAIDAGEITSLLDSMTRDEERFREVRATFLLY
jgi:uncharacterized protein YbbC (DUF1343 family)